MLNISQMETKRKMIHRDRIASFLDVNPWSSSLEIATALRISNVGARLSELRKMGILKQADATYTDVDGHTTHFQRYAIRRENT